MIEDRGGRKSIFKDIISCNMVEECFMKNIATNVVYRCNRFEDRGGRKSILKNMDLRLKECNFKGSIENYKDRPDKPWDWGELTRHIDINDIVKNPDMPWDWDFLSGDFMVPISIIAENLTLPWNFKIVSWKCCLSIDLITKYPMIPWDLSVFCDYNKISEDEIKIMIEDARNNL